MSEFKNKIKAVSLFSNVGIAEDVICCYFLRYLKSMIQ